METSHDNDPLERIRERGMRVVRLLHEGDCRYGLADDTTVTLISDEPFAAWEPEGVLPLADAHLLLPVDAHQGRLRRPELPARTSPRWATSSPPSRSSSSSRRPP